MTIFRMSSRPGRRVRVRLIAVDLDGTILSPDQTMSPRSVEAVRAVRALGIPVIPATSRGVLSVHEVLPFAVFGPMVICANGAVTINRETGAITREKPIDLAVAHALVEKLRNKIPSVSLGAETPVALYGEEWIMKDSMHQSDGQVISDISTSLTRAPLKLFAAAPGLDLEILAAIVAEAAGDTATLAVKDSWAELCAPGVNKASALDELSLLLGIDSAHALTVGDAENDLEMLEWSGISAAVQNAVPDVLSAADFVIPSNSDDGVAILLEELVANNLLLDLRDASNSY